MCLDCLKEDTIAMGREFKFTGALDNFTHPIRDSIYWVSCIKTDPAYGTSIRIWFLMGYWNVSEKIATHWMNRFKDRVIPDIYSRAILN